MTQFEPREETLILYTGKYEAALPFHDVSWSGMPIVRCPLPALPVSISEVVEQIRAYGESVGATRRWHNGRTEVMVRFEQIPGLRTVTGFYTSEGLRWAARNLILFGLLHTPVRLGLGSSRGVRLFATGVLLFFGKKVRLRNGAVFDPSGRQVMPLEEWRSGLETRKVEQIERRAVH